MAKDNNPENFTEEERKALLEKAFTGLGKDEAWFLTAKVLRGSVEEANDAQYVVYTDVYNKESEDYNPSEH